MRKKVTEEEERLLIEIVQHYRDEDRSVRERQIRTWRQLKLIWENVTNVYYDEVAHDWRVFGLGDNEQDDTDQSYYDKSLNVFRAYLESIIAALSVTVPPVKCFPDDATNNLDLATAKAGDKVAQKIYRQNDIILLWLHSLFIFCTEGMMAAYHYPDENKKYGMYEENEQKDFSEEYEDYTCPECGAVFQRDTISEIPVEDITPTEGENLPIEDRYGEETECPYCEATISPRISRGMAVTTKIIGKTLKPKSQVCIETYGGLYVKIPVYASCQEECSYLQFSYELDYALAIEEYTHLHGKLTPERIKSSSGPRTAYQEWGRLSPQYRGEYPTNVVTCEKTWLRPAAFNTLGDEEQVKHMKKKFPNGVKVVLINDEFCEACDEDLDDYWTISYNPLTDYLYYDPLGMLLVSVQEITNDLISLILQTIEHGIPQTFADPGVLNFNAYRQQPTTPGAIYEATPKSGRSVSDAFYEIKTSTLSQEVMPFGDSIQSLGQLTSGALPSLFGGDIQGSRTASQYSMSRAQALQRQQNTWKLLTTWWTNIFGKVIPMYIRGIKEDERDVQKNKEGNFINILISKADLEGKIGRVELDANENLPITWGQVKDVIMNLFESQNPKMIEILMAPENLPYLREALGLTDIYLPGEDDRNKQYDEIRELLNSEPEPAPPSEEEMALAQDRGLPMPDIGEISSVEIDPVYDNHAIHFEICRNWITSDEGRQAKIDNTKGYRNVLLHGKAHYDIMQQQMVEQQMQQGLGAPPAKPNEKNKEAPITGEKDVLANT